MSGQSGPRASRAGWCVLAAFLLTVAVATPPAIAAEALPWYQHYQRARERIAAGDCAGALVDLEVSRRDMPTPRSEVRTYGNNFLFGYDPELLRARCLLALDRLEEAADALAISDAAAVSPQPERDAVRTAIAARRTRSPETAPSSPPTTLPATITVAPDAARPSPDATTPGRSVTPPVTAAGQATDPRPARPLTASAAADQPTATTTRTEPAAPPLRGPQVTVTPSAPALGREPAASIGASGDRRQTSPLEEAAGASAPASAETVPSTTASAARPAPSDSAAPGAEPTTASPTAPPPSPTDATPPITALPTRLPGTLPLVALAAILALAGLAWSWRARHHAHGLTVLGVRTGRLRRVDGYQLLDELGRGGMATTWRARRLADGREVALKIPHESGDPTYRERFLREGRLGETLHHPNVVRILDVGEDGGVPFLVMELLPGRTLRAELDARSQGLPAERATALVRAIAEALDYAHGKGVVHRDLKPENVMLLPDGSVKVMDFGVARIEGQPGLTTSQVFFGSPLYAAPELVDPARIDRRADLYSLGALLWECLAGTPPYVDPSVFRVLELHQKAALPTPPPHASAVPAELWEIATRLLAKAPDERFQSAQELIVGLDRLSWRPTVPA